MLFFDNSRAGWGLVACVTLLDSLQVVSQTVFLLGSILRIIDLVGQLRTLRQNSFFFGALDHCNMSSPARDIQLSRHVRMRLHIGHLRGWSFKWLVKWKPVVKTRKVSLDENEEWKPVKVSPWQVRNCFRNVGKISGNGMMHCVRIRALFLAQSVTYTIGKRSMRHTSHSTWKDFLIEQLDDLKSSCYQRKQHGEKVQTSRTSECGYSYFSWCITHKTNAQDTRWADNANGYKHLGS